MSDVIEDIENRETKQPSKLLMLAVLFISIAAILTPLIIARMLYIDEGISKNTLLTELVLPVISLLFMLLTVLLVALTGRAGILNLVWFRLSGSEIAGTILLILIVTLARCMIFVLMRILGLSDRWDLSFLADGLGLSFFVTLTVIIAVLGPILEEIFWRGYVQATLERMFGGLPALLGQAVLFGAIHLRPLGGFVSVFVFGMIAGAWRWRRRTLIPVILAHIVMNSLWCAVHWPDWLDRTRVKITTDYLSQYKAIVRVNELDPNDNARDFYEKACQSVADVPTEWHKVRDIWPANWSPEQRATISAWLSASEQALDYVAEGTKKSYYWHEPSGPIMTLAVPELTGVRSVVFALYARSKLYAADGKLEQAFSDLVTCFQFGEHFVGRQPIISQLVGISTQAVAIKGIFRILENIEVKPAMLGHLQTRLEQSLADRTYSLDFTAERFVIYDHIQRMFTDDGKGGGYIPEIALRIPGRWKPLLHGVSEQEKRALLKLDRRSTTILADRFFDCLADATKMTAWQFQNDTSGVRKEIELIIKRNEFIAMFGSSYIKILGMYNRSKTNLEAVIATLAILRYETEKGRLPSSLEILVDEGYINALPQDSYSDGALVYKQKEDSFLLYSYGADFDDDGGTPSKWGEGKQGGDQVFWPVEKSQNYSESAM